MIKLSNRLKCIADKVGSCQSVADIGTDHGKLPIFLLLKHRVSKAILCDINVGPLKIARTNIEKLGIMANFEIRKGNGLENIESREVECIVIAGMGGLLIIDILKHDLAKSFSFQKFVLQPRNGSDKLRKWLFENKFIITDEELIKEGKFICEIITVTPSTEVESLDGQIEGINLQNSSALSYEISPILFEKADKLLPEFIERKIRVEKKILKEIESADNNNKDELLEKSKARLDLLIYLLNKADDMEVKNESRAIS